jgi:hypothetical protein
VIIDKLISELLILLERVRKGDFVLNLSRGEGIIGVPGTRVKNYVWCPRNSRWSSDRPFRAPSQPWPPAVITADGT